MGMYDNITCKAKFPDINLEGTPLTMDLLQKEFYQTKDLDCALMNYTIEEDGRLSYDIFPEGKWVESEENIFRHRFEPGTPVKEYFKDNASIDFYTSFNNDEGDFDYWVEWKALILGGVLTELCLLKFDKDSNVNRKQNEANYKEMLKRDAMFRTTRRYKYFYRWFNPLKRKLVMFLTDMLQRVISWLYQI
jgi:hypothetical protein